MSLLHCSSICYEMSTPTSMTTNPIRYSEFIIHTHTSSWRFNFRNNLFQLPSDRSESICVEASPCQLPANSILSYILNLQLLFQVNILEFCNIFVWGEIEFCFSIYNRKLLYL